MRQRTDEQKARRRTPEERAKANAYAREYRKRPDRREKHLADMRARHTANALEINQNRRERYRNDSSYRHQKRIGNICWLYGISPEEYNSLVLGQDGKCAVCHKPEGTSRRERLCVDHDHDTGKVRGLLCSGCNVALGLLEEDVYRIEELRAYLEKYNARLS